MSEPLKLVLTFLIGGSVVTLATYFGSKGSGILAAFITQFPSISVLAFYIIYKNGGSPAVMNYVEGFLLVVPPWILYAVIMYFFTPRIGVIYSLIIGVGSYMITAVGLTKLKDIFFK
ncbi:MAG: DUF3147 domain-containing protein [Spirochaetota bacterium]